MVSPLSIPVMSGSLVSGVWWWWQCVRVMEVVASSHSYGDDDACDTVSLLSMTSSKECPVIVSENLLHLKVLIGKGHCIIHESWSCIPLSLSYTLKWNTVIMSLMEEKKYLNCGERPPTWIRYLQLK